MSDTFHAAFAETLLLEGPDAATFAQGQFASDVHSLVPGQWQFSAWLNPQGRVRALFHLARLEGDRWLLILRGGAAVTLRQELQRYVFRLKLTLRSDSSYRIRGGAAMPLHEVRASDGLIRLGCGDHALQLATMEPGETGPDDHDNAWQLAQLRAGWPWLPDAALGTFLAPSLSLHRLGAVALDKGCYPGQEIVARLHYRGGNKRRLCHLRRPTQQVLTGAGNSGMAEHGSQLLQSVQVDATTEALAICESALLEALDASGTIGHDNATYCVVASFPD
ncbi:folate-binding protein [Dyella sp.]|jgi:hypothetical protein|uniref:CAF17-like 4Fe-4S cluster assembly/insertion protein YgfZ n=1 Tax=Dyella sp. TaxID=1869338 RepID=UPI002D782AA2|nr:folate-binding protein [Dyella sp.]HET6432448.1 folate-binding protein [Dyella sp.]